MEGGGTGDRKKMVDVHVVPQHDAMGLPSLTTMVEAVEADVVAEKAARTLMQKGYICAPLNGLGTDAERAVQRAALLEHLKGAPEFVKDAEKLVLGGFGALGNPGSFHNKYVRHLRMHVDQLFRRMLRKYIQLLPDSDRWNIEQLIDRACIRYEGTSVPGETLHRDTSDTAPPEDHIFGGWVNFDDKPQYLACVPASHTEPRPTGGFAKITDPAEVSRYKQNLRSIMIPPGAVVIFNQNLVHLVHSSGKLKENSYRVYVGFRITQATDPLVPNLAMMLRDQAAITIKSGQVPPMYGKLHMVNHPHLLENFSRNIRPELRVDGGIKFKKTTIVPRFMKSLATYNKAHGPDKFPLYPPYTAEEIAMYTPHK